MTTAVALTVRSRTEWAEIINADWRKSIEAIFQTGRDLLEAKNDLPHGEFKGMIENDLSFSYDTAADLMRVTKNSELSKVGNSQHLPQTFSVLVELSPLKPEQFQDAFDKGLIDPALKTNAARAITSAYQKPPGEVVPGGARHTLPSAEEARKIARATGRFVAARDGNIYSGSTKEEGAAYALKRNVGFRILEAIETLGDAPDAKEWMGQTEKHWFIDFRPGWIDDARAWLADLKQEMGIVDAN